jgi:hypothetical protein
MSANRFTVNPEAKVFVPAGQGALALQSTAEVSPPTEQRPLDATVDAFAFAHQLPPFVPHPAQYLPFPQPRLDYQRSHPMQTTTGTFTPADEPWAGQPQPRFQPQFPPQFQPQPQLQSPLQYRVQTIQSYPVYPQSTNGK